jgi:thiamine biosynthesis protein ThiS
MQNWLPGDTARPALVGRSVHSPESARASSGLDYVLAGHVFPSASKPDKPPLGLAGLAHIVSAAPCPVIAIGGLTTERVADVLRAGAHGVAVIGAIAEAPDPCSAARALRAAIDETLNIERKAPAMQPTDTTTQDATTFEIVVNGKSVIVPEHSTIHDFLSSKRMTGAMAIVERNGEIVPRGDYATTHVAPGDTIEVVHAVGGG